MKKPLFFIFGYAALIAPLQLYAATATLSEGEILSVVETANAGEIKEGSFAQTHANSTGTKEFAQQMVGDHTVMNDAIKSLAQKQGLKPQFNAVSKSLKDDGDKSLKKLKSLKGEEFDKTYIENEITEHKSVLDTFDNTLIPSAKNTEMKDALAQSRAKIAEHLEHAKQLQSGSH